MFNQTRQSLQAYDNQHEFERLAADILNSLGYQNVEPMAPLGGPDGGQDIKFTNGEENGVAFVTLRKDIKSKFSEDLTKQIKGEGEIALFSIVDISPKTKHELSKMSECKGYRLEIFDLERIRSLFDSTLTALRRRYLGIDDEISQKIRDEIRKLAKFPNTFSIKLPDIGLLGSMLINKTAQKLFHLLYSHNLNILSEITNIGNKLISFMTDYDSFAGKLQSSENAIIEQCGMHEACRFRDSWVIHYKYAILRFSGHNMDSIQRSGMFLNYGISWDSTERVYNAILTDGTLTAQLSERMSEYSVLTNRAQSITEEA